jgi:hypothetical protein
MRIVSIVAISILLVACHSPVEVSGLYSAYDDTGSLVRCDNPDTILIVRDSALAATYRVAAAHPYDWMFVRLRGVRADSGSIYGGSHHFLVQRVIELRARRVGECPRLTSAVPLLSRTAP